jgi:hypothetical protein
MGQINAYKILVGNPKGKRRLEKPRRAWEYDTRMELRDTVWEVVDWINPAQDWDQLRPL